MGLSRIRFVTKFEAAIVIILIFVAILIMVISLPIEFLVRLAFAITFIVTAVTIAVDLYDKTEKRQFQYYKRSVSCFFLGYTFAWLLLVGHESEDEDNQLYKYIERSKKLASFLMAPDPLIFKLIEKLPKPYKTKIEDLSRGNPELDENHQIFDELLNRLEGVMVDETTDNKTIEPEIHYFKIWNNWVALLMIYASPNIYEGPDTNELLTQGKGQFSGDLEKIIKNPNPYINDNILKRMKELNEELHNSKTISDFKNIKWDVDKDIRGIEKELDNIWGKLVSQY